MKRSSIIILPLVALIALSSCMKDLSVEQPAARTSVIKINPQACILSKAPLAGTTFPTTRTLVMSAYHNAPSGGTSENLFSGVSFTYGDGSWKGDKFWPAGGSLDLFAYSADGLDVTPSYKSNVGQGVTLTVPDNSTVQTDILWGYKANATAGESATSITMRHAEAAIAFTAKAATAYDTANNLGITITGITVSDVNCAGTAALGNSETCSWSGLGTKKTLTLPGLSSGYNVPATAMTISDSNPFGIGGTGLIVIPQAATSVTVTYTAHNGRKSDGSAIDVSGQTVTVSLSGTWTAGKKYVYTLDFADNVSLTTSVYEWTTGGGKKTVSATYGVSAQTSVSLPAATLSEGAVVSVDWGDGISDTYQASSSKQVTFTHGYSSSFTGTVNIIVHNGTIDFGEVKSEDYKRFKVNESSKVLMSEKEEFVFTVDGSGKKVEFSPANLYWDGSKFTFEEHQYDYPTSWNANHVGHFFWSKTASVAIASSYSDGSASTSDKFFASDGGAIEGLTVLSKDEWNYVINNHLGKYQVSIDGKNCAVLVPDGVAASVVQSSYTAAQWTQAEQDYGLVALPFAGYRYGTALYDLGSDGYYWSGSPYPSYSDSAYNAYFDSSYACTYNFDRYFGQSVRLVSVQ